MINLFNINTYKIDTANFTHLSHDKVVEEFEHRFAEYVGADFACSANSASSLLFLALKGLNSIIRIPSIIPAVVPNVILNTNNKVEFYDNIDWVGHYYKLYGNIFDSAQEVRKNQYKDLKINDATMIFSFYPTKPIGSCDGGMIVSNNKEKIDYYKIMTLNGMHYSKNNWEREQVAIGYKMHTNSLQAYIANENLKKLDSKQNRITEIREFYNLQFGYNNTSNHLYRIRVADNKNFIDKMKLNDIQCGIHYSACHKNPIFGQERDRLPKSEIESKQTVSLPCHENLNDEEIKKVVKYVREFSSL